MPENFKSRVFRWRFNLFPAYRRSGGRVAYVAHDYHEVRVEIPLNWKTRNYYGTIYGGTIYSAIDPIYMLMLIAILGPEYVVWDKAAKIRFRKPGRETLYAHFQISKEEVDKIRSLAASQRSIDRVYDLELADRTGIVHAEIEKTIYISKRRSEGDVK